MKINYPVFLFCLLLVFTINAFAQQSERDKGIALYKQGDSAGAARILQTVARQKSSKTDGEVWNYLGLAQFDQNKIKEARKALEKAVKFSPQSSSFHSNLAYVYLMERKTNKAQNEIETALRIDPQNANAYYIRGTAYLWEGKYETAIADADKAISVNSQFAAPYVLKSDGLLYSFGKLWHEDAAKPIVNLEILRQAMQVLDACLQKCTKNADLGLAVERLDTVKTFYEYFKKKKDNPNGQIEPSTDANITPLKILSKPRASYTDSARSAGQQGTITLAVVFSADAKIKHILLLKGLGYGLDQQALKAARSIAFEPQIENGKPVSVVKMLQYSFAIY
jgi:TonB family protein